MFEQDYELPFRRASSFPHISHWPWAGRINKDIIRETAANTKVPNEFPTSQAAQTRVPSAGNLCKAIAPTRLKFPHGGQDQRRDGVRWLPGHLRVRRYPRSNYSSRHQRLQPGERLEAQEGAFEGNTMEMAWQRGLGDRKLMCG